MIAHVNTQNLRVIKLYHESKLVYLLNVGGMNVEVSKSYLKVNKNSSKIYFMLKWRGDKVCWWVSERILGKWYYWYLILKCIIMRKEWVNVYSFNERRGNWPFDSETTDPWTQSSPPLLNNNANYQCHMPCFML